jgi:hypothetical protein
VRSDTRRRCEQGGFLLEKAREKLVARAMELLRLAVAKGFKNAAHMKKDTDLDALRQREDFQKLLAELEKPQPK